MIVLHDLCAGDPAVRFSPYCWRARMALAHKDLAFEARPTPFTGIAAATGGFSQTVPVIEDGAMKVRESFDIAAYLEEAYPDRPSLFGGPGGLAVSRFVDYWAFGTLHSLILRLVIRDIHDTLAEPDRAYFRASREKRFGEGLESMQAGREGRLEAFRQALGPLRATLKRQPWLGGDAPLYADYIVFGTLQWPRMVSGLPLLAEDDPVHGWFERCLDLHGGLGRAVPRAVA